MNAFLLWLLEAAASWAAGQVLSALINRTERMRGEFVAFYEQLLKDIRKITGEVIADNEIGRCSAELRAIMTIMKEIMGRYSSPAPIDILTELRQQKDNTIKLLYQNERFFVKTFQAYYLLTTLLVAIYAELAKLDPKHSMNYRGDAIARLKEAYKAFQKYSQDIFQKKATLLCNQTPLHMDERGIFKPRPGGGGIRNDKILERVGTEYLHSFHFVDMDGSHVSWVGTWNKNRAASHNAGASKLSGTVWSSKHIAKLREEIRDLQQGLLDATAALESNKSFNDLPDNRPKAAIKTDNKALILASTKDVVEFFGNITILPSLKPAPSHDKDDAESSTSLASNHHSFHATAQPAAETKVEDTPAELKT